MKRIARQVFLCALLATLALPAAVHAQFTYTTNADHTLTITGYTGSGGVVSIPSTINGLPVSSIGCRAFFYCFSLSSVTIPDSVTSIGKRAFSSCTSLASIHIGNSVVSIGDNAFAGCQRLTSVTIPNGLTNIGEKAFGICPSLVGVTIPASVTSIGKYAFLNCPRLTDIYFKGNTPSLGDDVFEGDEKATVYYRSNTTGWGKTFGGRPTAVWNPQAMINAACGVQAK